MIFDLRFIAQRSHNLAQRNSAIIGRHALMPVWLKFFFAQPRDNAPGQITVLKTATTQYDSLFAGLSGDFQHRFGQSIVKFGGNEADRNATFYVGQKRFNR